MKKVRLALGAFIVMLIVPILLQQVKSSDEMSAASAPSFNIYNKVRLANNTYTVIGTDSNSIKVLLDKTTGTKGKWATATTELDTFSTAGVQGQLGSDFLSDKLEIPAYADVSPLISGSYLNSKLPSVSGDWWLSDPTNNNRNRFISASNQIDKEVTINEITVDTDADSCVTQQSKEKGVMPTSDQADVIDTVFTKREFDIVLTTQDGKPNNTESFAPYLDTKCSSQQGSYIPYTEGNTVHFTYKRGNGTIPDTLTAGAIEGSPIARYFITDFIRMNGLTYREVAVFAVKESKISFGFTNGIACTDISAVGEPDVLTKSVKMPAGKQLNMYAQFKNFTDTETKQKTCTGAKYTDNIAFIRPMATIPLSDIIAANTSKRTFTPGATLSGSFPSSDPVNDKSYLTISDPSLIVSLDQTATGVDGTTYDTIQPSNGILSIPVSLSGKTEGARYVSASATINGREQYGVLKQMTSDSDTISIDLHQFAENPSSLSQIKLTLYHENAGSFMTAYMGNGTEITINLQKAQEIVFDEGQTTSATYGDVVTLRAHLVSDVNDQSSQPITFSILTNNARIDSQSYVAADGTASVSIVPLSGSSNVKVVIDKAGDANAAAAAQKTYVISLQKKAISIFPNCKNAVFGVGDAMPTIGSSSIGGFVNGDQMPANFKPNLEPLNGAATNPATDGVITEIGTWKLVYPLNYLQQFPDLTNKYNITLVDYNTDPQYTLETVMSDIPDGWVIVDPNANAQGWNSTTVTIKPSADAIANGFTVIESVNDAGTVLQSGASIVIANETTISGETVKVQLKKGGYTSNTVNTRTIYIDKTKPSASLTVEKEFDWTGSKKIDITATDTLSKIQSVSVERNGTPYTPTLSGNTYTFTADENGTYTITITDKAGNTTVLTKEITKIDHTAISISATPETVSTDVPRLKITLSYQAGTSGVKSLSVYYKATASDSYTLLDDTVSKTDNPLDWYAEMNGYFKFELINNANEITDAEVHITQVNPPVPVTQIIAYKKGDSTTPYTNDTWVNHDVTLEITNANSDVSETVTWEYSTDNGGTWTALSATAFDVNTSTAYLFRGKTTSANEQSPKAFAVKMDKTAPDSPVVTDANRYTQNNWYAYDVTLSIHTVEKANHIPQMIYVCEADETTCKNDATKWLVNNGTLNFTGNGSHELYFKSIDEAGNESAVSNAIYVNINASQPTINIKIQNDPVKQLLNSATLGFFFKDTVSIDIEVTYPGTGQSGDVYYIIEPDDTVTAPTEQDGRWTPGNHTTITPDAKGKIYVKAVSAAGVIAYEDSVLSVYVDASDPIITMPADMSDWTNDPVLELEITDALSGVDPASLRIQEDSGSPSAFSLVNDKASITLSKNGNYPVQIAAQDRSGNSASETMQVMLDTQDPQIGTPSPDTNGYAGQRTITVSASDSLSGIDQVSVKKSNGASIAVHDNGDGTYSFTVTENDTYTITASDVAGNTASSDYTEAMIDTDGPVIDNIQITDEHEVRPSKTVDFEVSDALSGVDQVSVSIENNGTLTPVHVNIPASGNTYSFTATENGTYTVTATDHAGNTYTKTIQVSDIDTSGIRIVNISDTGTWTKDQMDVHFEVDSGVPLASGYPIVTYKGNPVILSEANGVYSFTAVENGDYTIKVMDDAGQSVQEVVKISRIDAYAPVVENISNNTTSEEYRGPQNITFQIHDYNDAGKSVEGSGMKHGYPKLSITLNGVKTDIALIQDPANPNQYSFLAEYNGDYILEFQDAVEHPVVLETIPVDHILDQSVVSEILVEAYNDTNLITSGTWVKGSIRFEISGGLDASTLSNYQVAVTDGTKPVESDWNDCNQGIHEHEITGNINGDVYWFRAVPIIYQAPISRPFVVHLDNTPPDTLTIQKRTINTGPIARLVHALSFGGWLSEAQEVTFDAQDNFTAKEDITYMYREINPKDLNAPVIWKRYSAPLTYDDSNVKLLVKAIDQAGNESTVEQEEIKIDSVPPVITGVKDESEYKFYYLPRYIAVSDQGSGIANTSYRKDNGGSIDFNREVSLKEVGTYDIYTNDQAGNETTLAFKIVPMPDLDDIDGSDESKEIIDQIKEELAEIIDQIDANESANYDKWIEDAEDKWNASRLQELIHEDTTTKVEGEGTTTFDPNTKLVVEEKKANELPKLPNQLYHAYDVYLTKDGVRVDANGKMKVYLPYDGTEEVILYEVHKDASITEISYRKENGYLVFETDALSSYALTLKGKPVDPEQPDPKPEDPEQPDPKPEEPKKCPADINYDSDNDGKPDVNVDLDGDCEADINIDINGDHIPDIDIDTVGDGKPHYNVDKNNDKKADLNIGPLPKPWKPDFCTTVNKVEYCSMKNLKPEVNIDTDDDGEPDINVDVDGDGKPDINIDVDGDGKADVNIDSDGDHIADTKLDKNGNGVPDDDEKVEPGGSGTPQTSVQGTYHQTTTGGGMGGASTGDETNIVILLTLISLSSLLLLISRRSLKS